MTEIAFGPYEPDRASVGRATSSYVSNVLPSVNGYAPFPDISSFTNAMSGYCRGMFGGVQLDGSSVLFAGSDTKLYKLNGTTRSFDDVSRVAGGAYSVGAREYWDFCQYGNTLIAATDSNDVQAFTLGSSTNFAALAGSPPQACRCAVVGDFVVLSSLSASGNANRIQWSGINDSTSWTVGTNQSDYQDFPDGGFVQGVSGGEIGIVFQDRAIRRMIYVGPPDIFDFQRISDNKGCMMRYSICRSAGYTFFMSNDGFYKIDLSGAMTQIGANRVNKTILAELDTGNHRYMIGVADPVYPRVIWFYKTISNGNPNSYDKAIVYDWSLDKWSPVTRMFSGVCPMIQLSATLEGLDAVSGSLDALPLSLDSYTYDYAQRVAAMGSDNKVGFFSGSNLEATLDTPEGMIGDSIRTFVRGAEPITDAANVYVSTRHRDRITDSLTSTSETQIGVNGYAPQRVNARFNTIRVRVAAGQNWSYMRGVEVDVRAGGKR